MEVGEFKTPLAKVKGLGSAKSGTEHFIYQRVSALILCPLLIWLAYTLLKFFNIGINAGLETIAKPHNSILLLLTVIVMLYHGMLGVKVIIEDYIHCECMKTISIVLLYGFTYLTMAVAVLTIVTLHIKFYLV